MQLFLVSVTLPLVIIAAVYVLSSFILKVKDWRSLGNNQPVVEKPVTVEIDKSSVE